MNRKEKDFISYLRSSHKRGEIIWVRAESPRPQIFGSFVQILTARIDGYVVTLTYSSNLFWCSSRTIILSATRNLKSDFNIHEFNPGLIGRHPLLALWNKAEKSVREREDLAKATKIQEALSAFALTIP